MVICGRFQNGVFVPDDSVNLPCDPPPQRVPEPLRSSEMSSNPSQSVAADATKHEPQNAASSEISAVPVSIPTRPAAFDKIGITQDDLIDFTPELRAEAVKQLAKVRLGKNAFTPPSLANAPDGNLFILDMYREVIEHPDSLPPIIKKHLDLSSGSDRGRIYRLAADGFTPKAAPDLGKLSSRDLVPLLAHPNAWHRETAARLLYERQDASIAFLLADAATSGESDLGRMTALATAGPERYAVAVGLFTDKLEDTLFQLSVLLGAVWLGSLVLTAILGFTLASRALEPVRAARRCEDEGVDAVVLGLPNGQAAAWAAALPADVAVVDLSADHRFDDRWVYGLVERDRARLQGAKRIANPGCYATATQLALWPFADVVQRLEDTLGILQNALTIPAREGAALMVGLRAAFDALRSGLANRPPRRTRSRSSDDEDALFI